MIFQLGCARNPPHPSEGWEEEPISRGRLQTEGDSVSQRLTALLQGGSQPGRQKGL